MAKSHEQMQVIHNAVIAVARREHTCMKASKIWTEQPYRAPMTDRWCVDFACCGATQVVDGESLCAELARQGYDMEGNPYPGYTPDHRYGGPKEQKQPDWSADDYPSRTADYWYGRAKELEAKLGRATASLDDYQEDLAKEREEHEATVGVMYDKAQRVQDLEKKLEDWRAWSNAQHPSNTPRAKHEAAIQAGAKVEVSKEGPEVEGPVQEPTQITSIRQWWDTFGGRVADAKDRLTDAIMADPNRPQDMTRKEAQALTDKIAIDHRADVSPIRHAIRRLDHWVKSERTERKQMADKESAVQDARALLHPRTGVACQGNYLEDHEGEDV